MLADHKCQVEGCKVALSEIEAKIINGLLKAAEENKE